jgi:hypothetical protein
MSCNPEQAVVEEEKSARGDSHTDEGLFSLLATPVLIIDVVAVLFFNLGWTYIYYFYDNFGVNVHALNIPIYYFFVYALPVIYMKKWRFILLISAGVFALVLMKLLKRRWQRELRRIGEKKITVGIVTLLLLSLLTFGDSWAQQTAKETATELRNGNAKRIRFLFKENSTTVYPQQFLNANNTDKLKLLTQTADRFVVFYQPEGDEKVLPIGSTYVIFNSDVRLADIEIENVQRKE